MGYSVSFKASAVKQIQKLPKHVAQRVFAQAEELAENPYSTGCAKLAGSSGMWRIRIGDYRVVYVIDDKAKSVDIRVVAHRKDVYRDL